MNNVIGGPGEMEGLKAWSFRVVMPSLIVYRSCSPNFVGWTWRAEGSG